MNCKKLILFYGLTAPMIGIREHHYDWKEGDELDFRRAKTEVYAVFDVTHENMLKMYDMFKELNTPTSMKGLRCYLDCEGILDMPEECSLKDWPELQDVLPYMMCNKDTRKKRQWKDYDRMLDFMEECATEIA